MKGKQVNVLVAAGAVAVGSLCGGLAGYGLARARARREYASRLDVAVAEIKAHYSRPLVPKTMAQTEVIELDPDRPRYTHLVRDTINEMNGISRGGPLEGVNGDKEFCSAGTEDDDGQVPAGVDIEEPPFPFQIPEAQFGELNAEGFQTISVTYYAADKVLVDDKDQPIRDIQGTVGTVNPLGFGGISGDPHIRYVRNRRLEVDFEILLDARSYAETILGYGQPNRRHEASPKATSEAD